jgi:hypothetical protein
MNQTNSRILSITLLLFHAVITAHGFYTMFADFDGWNLYHARPLMQLLFTFVWLIITLKKRWGFFVYITLIFYELTVKLFFGQYEFGQIFGDVFFPADLLFAFIVLLLYKQLFHKVANEASE